MNGNQPIIYLRYSNLRNEGETGLTRAQVHELGDALEKIRSFFSPMYGSSDWWAMDVEFEFDGLPGQDPALYIK